MDYSRYTKGLKRSLSPNRDKRRRLFLLRGLLLFAVGGLLINAERGSAGWGALALVLAFAASNALLFATPLRWIARSRFDLLIGALDLILVALGIQLSGAHAGVLPISCLLMVLVVALSNYKTHVVAGATAVGALHTWMVVGRGSGLEAATGLALQVLFLCSIALYYGFLVEGIHGLRARRAAKLLERRELAAIVDIQQAVTSSLDVRRVTQMIVQRIDSVVDSARCSLIYIDTARNRCFVLASHDDPDVNMLELDLDKYPEIREAIRTREPVIISDVARDPLMAEVKTLLVDRDFHSILVLPLTFGEDLLGTLLLKTARVDQEYTDAEIGFCRAVAGASANALKNAILHRELKEQVDRHSEIAEKLENLLKHSPDLVVTTDAEGHITEFNRGAELLLGWEKAEVLGQPYAMLFADDSATDLVARTLSSASLRNQSCVLRRKDGGELSTEITLSTLWEGTDRIAGTVWIGRDVSELEAARLQLAQAEKLSSIGNVMSGVAHELNNPLSVVIGYAQLLRTRRHDAPEVRELDKINDAALRCQKIVQNLLSFARAHKPERSYLGVNDIVEKTVDVKKYQLMVKNIELKWALEPELPGTMLDFHQIQQVLLNLIHNAQHAMDAVNDRPRRLTIRTSHGDGRIRIEISDTGEGMDDRTLRRIFDPFFSTKEQGVGTGLGLSVSYGIIQEHEGRIYAHSKPGEGSTFVIELPIREPETLSDEPVEQSARPTAAPAEDSRVLVVDDEPMIVDLLLDILGDLGHDVDCASNGQEAIEKASRQDYDLVLTDVRMPGMNGIELYRKLLTLRPEMEGHVVFITGDLIDRDTVEFLAETKARAIGKPLEVAKIIETVEQALFPVPNRSS